MQSLIRCVFGLITQVFLANNLGCKRHECLMNNCKELTIEGFGDKQQVLNTLSDNPTRDYVSKVARMANTIKVNQLREKMDHQITEGDVWAIIGAVRELTTS